MVFLFLEVNLKSKGQGVTALHIAARLKDRKREAALVREATIASQTEQADDDDEPDFLTDVSSGPYFCMKWEL